MSSLSMVCPSKRKAIDLEVPTSTPAAQFNHRVLKRLQRTLEINPEADLSTVLPSNYASRLAGQASCSSSQKSRIPSQLSLTPHSDRTKTPEQLSDQGDYDEEIPFGLTRDLEELFEQERRHSNGVHAESDVMSGVHEAIRSGKVLWRSEVSSSNMVVKCNEMIAVKVIPRTSDYTEYTSLQYLQANLPEVPGPRPLGVVSSGPSSYIFMTYVPGASLDKIWLKLDAKQKRFIASQVSEILGKMRQQSCPWGMALGGVGGEGCKDARRHTRICQHQIFNATDFINFLFSDPHFGGSVYVSLLRGLWQTQNTPIVFTHGDLQPSNIMIEERNDGYHKVTGLVDWERSGFYPDWVECVKATNDLSKTEAHNDWSLFLPDCISADRHRESWLLDRLWDMHVA